MRICIATSGPGGLKDYVSPVFGRCPTYTLIDIEGSSIKNITVVQNFAPMLGGGAGIQAAQMVVNSGCNVAIAGSFGPNSSQILSMARVDARVCPPMPVEKAIDLFNKGMLQPLFAMHIYPYYTW